MKYLIAAFSGFALTLGVFAGGVFFAVTYLSADPVAVQQPRRDAGLVLPTGVVKVDVAKQDYERVEARPPREPVLAASAPDTVPPSGIDNISTAALPDDDEAPTLSSDHVAWCREHYRSYRPEDNSYTPYSGGSRECVSPYFGGAAELDEPLAVEASATGPMGDYAAPDSFPADTLSSGHVESCFARYRSYRPEDNSYQPYGGGPRQQCR